MTKRLVLGFAAVLALMLALPEDASAQYFRPQRPRMGARHRPHLYVGGELTGLAIVNETADARFDYLGHGGGGGLYVGFRLSPFFALEGSGVVTYHDEQYDAGGALSSLYLLSFSANAKIILPTFGPLEPYFQGGIGYAYRGIVWDDGWGGSDSIPTGNGPTFNLGGGVDFYVGPQISIGARLLYRGYYFFEVGDPRTSEKAADYISGISFDVNATFHF